MHSLSASFVLAYHGCDQDVADRVLAGEHFAPGTNDYDWLGHGIYFWEANPKRGFDYAGELAVRKRGSSKVTTPAVVGAIIDMRLCLDLTTASGIEQARLAYRILEAVASKSSSGSMPGNNKDGLRRNLDCAVINMIHEINKQSGSPSIDTVKGAFIEGDPIYPLASFHEKPHIQICVRNQDNIKGTFRVPDPVSCQLHSRQQGISAADVRRWTPMQCAGLKTADDSLDLDASLTEIDQQAQMQPCCRQIVDALGHVRCVERANHFQFNQDGIVNQQVGDAVAHDDTVVLNRNPLLWQDRQSSLAQFMRQGGFINRLRETGTQPIHNPECTADNDPRKQIHPGTWTEPHP